MFRENGKTKNLAYVSLEEDLRRDIFMNRLRDDEAVPSENELCDRYGLSRNTVRKALCNLVEDGLLYKVKGSGTFVVPASKRRKMNCETKTRQVVFLSLESALTEAAFRDKAVYEPIFRGLNRVLQPEGYNLLLAHVHLDWSVPSCLLNSDVSGIIFHGQVDPEFWKNYILPLPHVGINHVDETLESHWVMQDFYNMAFQAVGYLKKHGHRRIGFVSNEAEIPFIRSSYKFFLEAMQAFGLPFDPAWNVSWQREGVDGILQKEYEIPDYRPFLEKAFQAEETPTAFFCLDDWRAICTMRALKRMGYRVPDDISIMGTSPDQSPYTEEITGFNYHLADVCSEAARLLLSTFEGTSAGCYRKILIRPELIEGSTVKTIQA